jgi:hypothetical protein
MILDAKSRRLAYTFQIEKVIEFSIHQLYLQVFLQTFGKKYRISKTIN